MMRETIVSPSPVLAQLVRHVVDLARDERDALVKGANMEINIFLKKHQNSWSRKKTQFFYPYHSTNFQYFRAKEKKIIG